MNGSVETADRPQTVPAYVSVKGDDWRQRVIEDIKLNTNAIESIDKHILNGKNIDPLPNIREIARQLSNEEAFRYMRQCRLITARLRQSWVDVNEEIKSLSRSKVFLESTIDHMRKDAIINHETIYNRTQRPGKETDSDAIDEMLNVEKHNLSSLKRLLENHLKQTATQLTKLNETREILYKQGRERSRVTELICQCFSQALRTYDMQKERNKSKSNNTIIRLTKSNSTLAQNSSSELNGYTNNNQISASTAATDEIIDTATRQTLEGRELRRRAKILIDETMENSKTVGQRVDDLFIKKISETISLSQNLSISIAENRLAQNRGFRWSELSNIALKYSLGPEKAGNLQLYEKLDRPIIKTYQRHAGTQLPEGQELIKASGALAESFKRTGRESATLEVVGQQLNSNLKDKEDVIAIENNLLRRRRHLADHKWVPVKYLKETRGQASSHQRYTPTAY